MKQRLLSLALALSLLPTMAVAAETGTGNFADSNVTWLGSQAEYQKTLDGMFPNGLRKIKAGDKWGIVDATGAFVAPPIYDKIELNYGNLGKVDESGVAVQHIFMDGYAQCVRGGKYGLLNQYGEEAVPAKYDYVGLPSEGVCRIYATTGGKTYLGYWNLEQGREIVAPNKYESSIRDQKGSRLGPDTPNQSGFGIPGSPEHTRTKGTVLDNTMHDFQDGYAFVSTTNNGPAGELRGVIIDKNGKEILPGGPYLVATAGETARDGYPQYGPYLTVKQKAPTSYPNHDNEPYWFSGVVGPQGVILPTEYSGGQTITAGTALNVSIVGDAEPAVIPEHSLVIISKDTTPGKHLGGRRGVVNFQNLAVLPFEFTSISYEADYDLFIGNRSFDNTGNDTALYNTQGKKISKDYLKIDPHIINDYVRVTTYTVTNANGIGDRSQGFLNVKTGKECFLLPTSNPDFDKYEYSDFSVGGLVWQKNPQGKWGLVNAGGQEILPHQYDAVDFTAWTRAKNGYATVHMGQKQGLVNAAGQVLLPCEYTGFDKQSREDPEYIVATKETGTGLFSVATGKFAIPCVYAGIGGEDARGHEASYFRLGVNVVKTTDGYALVDQSGTLIPGSQNKRIYEPMGGVFHTGSTQRDYLGADGKIVFPGKLNYTGRKNFVTDDTTLVVKDGKVGYINAAQLAQPTQPKTCNPATATANPSPTKLMVNGKAVAASAYLIGQNNYVKLRDLAYLVNGTGKNFEVTWDGARNAINLKSATQYTTVAGDMAPAAGGAQTATRSSSTVYVDGLGRSLTAYTINSNNYFKLRDVMRVFDIAVGYDNATGTATLDTSKGYTLTDGEQAGITPAPGEATPPPAAQVNKLELTKVPKLEFYLEGNNAFHTAGFELRYWDEKGVDHTITDVSQMEFKVEGKVVQDGYVFQSSSMKEATVGYKGLTAAFRIPVYQGAGESDPGPADPAESKLPDGKYTLTVLGNTVGVKKQNLVLDSKNPVTISVKKVEDHYLIYLAEETKNMYVSPSGIRNQVDASSAVEKFACPWTITSLGGDTYSIREYKKPEMLLCTGAAAKTDGTFLILWKNTKTPEHAIFTFTPVQ